MGKKEKRNYEDMDCLEVNLNVKAVIVYQGFFDSVSFLLTKKIFFWEVLCLF